MDFVQNGDPPGHSKIVFKTYIFYDEENIYDYGQFKEVKRCIQMKSYDFLCSFGPCLLERKYWKFPLAEGLRF